MVAISNEFEIVKVVQDGRQPTGERLETICTISPEQAALGALEDHEVAIVLLNREGIRDNWRSNDALNDALVAFAKELGFWPPEVTT